MKKNMVLSIKTITNVAPCIKSDGETKIQLFFYRTILNARN